MAKVTETRLTIAAFIYAIEIDLKILLNQYLIGNFQDLSFLRNEETIEKLKKRFKNDNPGLIPEDNIQEVIEFLDFQETYTIILINQAFFPEHIFNEIKSLVPSLDNLAPIRNRVMHTRPLMSDDFSNTWMFISKLAESKNINWVTLKDTKSKIESDPSYVLTLSIPFYGDKIEESYHNLPAPDFDETGFIGRKKDILDVSKLILGNNRVVSIIGEGGVGKSALALKVAYDILDLKEKNPFDIIIWITAKSTMLTASGILEIKNALKDYAGVIEGISNIIGGSKNNLEDILEYLDVFKVLLIVDNLETILDEDVREFIREAQMKCKVLITSRIGLGELEFRRPISGLSESESIQLIRQFASIKQSDILNRLPSQQLIAIADKLHYNPLALKWFVSSVELGTDPNVVVTDLEQLLTFCLSNVYEKLSNEGKQVINTILAARKNLNDAQLIYLTGLPSIILRRTINELFSTTIVSREIIHNPDGNEVMYQISDFAKDYILLKHPVEINFVKNIINKINSLSKSTSELNQATQANEFALNAITIRNVNEKVTARLISEALKLSKNGSNQENNGDLLEAQKSYSLALEKLSEAKSILPSYFEIYRVTAFIKATSGDILGAEQEYLTAFEMEPDNPRLLYFYAGFLLYNFDDLENATVAAEKLYRLRPNSNYPALLLSRCYSESFKHKEAIELVEKVIEKGNLNKSELRVANTDLISMYGYWGNEIVQNQGDYQKAIVTFRKGISVFESCVNQRNFDGKMIKNFCQTLKSFIKAIPKMHNEDNLEYIKGLFIKYDDQLALNQSKNYLSTLLQETYGIKIETNDNGLHGSINRINPALHFSFITVSDGSDLFAGENAFKYRSDFENLKEGDKVSYQLGENKQGKCAVNVIVEA